MIEGGKIMKSQEIWAKKKQRKSVKGGYDGGKRKTF